MEKSEKLYQEAAQEENDLKYMGIIKKANREKRAEVFLATLFPRLVNSGYVVEEPDDNKFSIITLDHGIVDFFPKANKVLIRKKNEWVPYGSHWIEKNLINPKVNITEGLKDIWDELQDALYDMDDYTLKTDEELVNKIKGFGCGHTEFHTADIERLLKENEFLKAQLIKK